jgi:ribonuclease-3
MMTAWRAALVRTESIGEASREIGYEPLVRMSHGERSGADRSHSKIIADCFEATTAAIYLDQGFETARDYIYKHIITHMEGILNEGSWRDPKSYLQELAQKAEGVTPQYHVVKEEGPDHLKTFTINVVINGHLRGTGTGHSKLEAQNNAAREGVKYYKSQKVSTNGRLTL